VLLPAFHLHLCCCGTKEPLTRWQRQGRERMHLSRAIVVRASVRPIHAAHHTMYECSASEDTPGSVSLSRRPAAAAAGYDYINIADCAYDNRAVARGGLLAAGGAEWGQPSLPIGSTPAHKYMDMIQVRTRIISGPAHQTRLPSAGHPGSSSQARGECASASDTPSAVRRCPASDASVSHPLFQCLAGE
jgi:hypothetical protein